MKASYRKKFDVFKDRYFNSEHTCPMRDRVLNKVQATVEFVNDIIIDIREFYGVQISYQQAWRAKEHALEMIRGKPSVG
ncbi:hypothetical protein H5410_063005 [Solanum commersonii]|uniref:Uncharacterized protein n=1 Tax=Solanum commersonii TaxID=4109 RepID=A0A9J5WD42_SOLCO|nr:hypothetical protein H5410_063005 [Solanum commersonii]